jgi:hypothetical protein
MLLIIHIFLYRRIGHSRLSFRPQAEGSGDTYSRDLAIQIRSQILGPTRPVSLSATCTCSLLHCTVAPGWLRALITMLRHAGRLSDGRGNSVTHRKLRHPSQMLFHTYISTADGRLLDKVPGRYEASRSVRRSLRPSL